MIVIFNEIIESLQDHQPIVFPTETVYGLFAVLGDQIAYNKIYKIKNREWNKKLATYDIFEDCDLDFQHKIIDEFQYFIDNNLTNHKVFQIFGNCFIINGVAYRFVSNEWLKLLIRKVGRLVGTSANISHQNPITLARHCTLNVPIFDGGMCEYGIESTIFDLDNKQIIRSKNQDVENKYLYWYKINKII